uniref:RIKEN cDNA 6030498E09 gene n=1 Tax=Nannospalax galili TaxID=1026970 RepID=A0A8C6RC21_NANGA
RPHFHASNGSGRFPQRRRGRVPSQKSSLQGLCLYLILCFCLCLGLGLGLGLGLNPGFGLSLGLGLGTVLSIRLSQSLDLSEEASLDTVQQESTDNAAVEDGSIDSVVEVTNEMTNENIEEVSDVREINKSEYENWEDVHNDAGGEKAEEAAEDEQGDPETEIA